MKYKLIKEYDKFYLCEYEVNGNKFKECLLKVDYKIENGYVVRKRSKWES